MSTHTTHTVTPVTVPVALGSGLKAVHSGLTVAPYCYLRSWVGHSGTLPCPNKASTGRTSQSPTHDRACTASPYSASEFDAGTRPPMNSAALLGINSVPPVPLTVTDRVAVLCESKIQSDIVWHYTIQYLKTIARCAYVAGKKMFAQTPQTHPKKIPPLLPAPPSCVPNWSPLSYLPRRWERGGERVKGLCARTDPPPPSSVVQAPRRGLVR